MVIHFIIGYIIIVAEDASALDDVLFHYLGGVQIVIFFIFAYAFYKLYFAISENPDSTVEKEVKVMNGVSIVVVLTLLFRIVYNLGLETFELSIDTRDIIDYIFSFLSELVPCFLITLILFFQQQNLTDSVLRGSSFARELP